METQEAERTTVSAGRPGVQQGLEQSDGDFRSLFEHMLDGFAYCKILVDENGQPEDFEYIEVNDAFEKLIGLKREDVVGKRVTEAFPGIKDSHPELIDIYGKVALTGKPARFDLFFKPLGMWLTISVYSPRPAYFATVFDHVTEREWAEIALEEALRQAKGRNEEVVALLEGSRAIVEHRHEFAGAAHAIYDSCRRLIGATAGFVALLGKDGAITKLTVLDSGGMPPPTVSSELARTIALWEEARRGGKVVYDNHFAGSSWAPLLPNVHLTSENALLAPLVVDKDTVGALGLANKPGGFTHDDARLATSFSGLLTMAVINSRTQEALRLSEENFRRSIDDSLLGVRIVSGDGHILYANRAMLDLYGYDTLAELQAVPNSERLTPESHVAFLERREKRRNGEYVPPRVEVNLVRKNGETRRVQVFRKDIIWSGQRRIQHLCHDITETSLAQEAALQAYSELDRIFNAAADGMYVTDTDYTIQRINDKMTTLFRGGADAAVGKKCYDVLHFSCCRTAQCPLALVLAGAERVEDQIEGRPDDGSRMQCRLAASPLYKIQLAPLDPVYRRQADSHLAAGPLFSGSSEVIGMVASVTDLSELRKSQQQLQDATLLASLGEMTAGVAHEVNNPLSSILLYSELLLAGDIPAQLRKDLKVIHSEARRAASIMTKMLVYARSDQPRTRRMNLHRTLRKVLRLRQYQHKVNNIGVVTNLTEGALPVRGDASQLVQLFMNIIINAEDVLKEKRGGEIVISTERNRKWARISISDDGTGISKENMRRLFHPFFTTKKVGEGTGLGLSVCYGIVTSHGGSIRAENNSMGGATFVVELPLANGPAGFWPATAHKHRTPLTK